MHLAAPRLRRRALALLLALGAAAALPAAARAQEVRILEPGTDIVQGLVAPGDTPRLLPVRLFGGAPFTVEVAPAKGSALRPAVRLLGLDRATDEDAAFVAKGSKVVLKNYIPAGTGIHWLEVSGADGTTGGWSLKTKVKIPKKAVADGAFAGDGKPVTVAFDAPGRAVATVTVKGLPKEAGAPAFVSLRDPSGGAVDPAVVKPGRTGFTLKGVPLPRQGGHALVVAPGTPTVPGTFAVKLAWKVTPPARRALDAADVIADPWLVSLTPSEGAVTQVVPMVLEVDFARPGAFVEFRAGNTVFTVPAGSITLLPGEARFSVNLGAWSPGTYDCYLRNTDGGVGMLPGALVVKAVAPQLASVAPAWAYEGGVVRLRISGADFTGNPGLALRLGEATLPGAFAGSGPGFVDADFDLAGAAVAAWDVVVTNAGAPPAILEGAFDVREIVTLVSMTPADNRDGDPVAATLVGTGFLPGTAARLVREDGGEEIVAADLVVASRYEIHCSFDTAEREPATFDLELTAADGVVFTLPAAFRVRAPKGEPGEPVQSFSAAAVADGPPVLVHDPSRGGFLAVWSEEDNGGIVQAFHVYAMLLDGDGLPAGSPVSLSDDGGPARKRYATAGYDPVNDEYLVCWTEEMAITPQQTGVPHPSGSSSVPLFQVVAQRLAASDASKLGSNIHVTDAKTGYSGAQKGVTWYLSDFHSYRPALAFDEGAGLWSIAWMEEFDTTGLYFSDNFDVFLRTLDPTTAALGSLVQVARTDYQEGDPALAYDADGGRVLVAYNARSSTKGGTLDLYLGAGGGGTRIVDGNGDDLGDPRLAVDPISGTAVLSWTRVAGDGTRAAEAAAVALSDLSATVGETLVLASGGTDMLVRPAVNEDLEEIHLHWTRMDEKDNAWALRRTATVTADGGLVAATDEEEISGGSATEGLPVAAYSAATGETAVLWMAGLFAPGNPTYPGDTLPKGIVQGLDFWFRLYR